jgi:hypothetical protein
VEVPVLLELLLGLNVTVKLPLGLWLELIDNDGVLVGILVTLSVGVLDTLVVPLTVVVAVLLAVLDKDGETDALGLILGLCIGIEFTFATTPVDTTLPSVVNLINILFPPFMDSVGGLGPDW